ncbi:MAG TPA: lysylphosphatidylglycerol synthase transmembrane domain-containing protein [Phnomibacter sp.]|nr:lysylphosphatidylglycerol synthase transmembrane domain-containing protein [Phnomibacter sp.]
MFRKLRSVLQYLFFLGLGLLLIWYSAKDLTPAQISELKGSFAQTRFLYILPVIFALLLSHYHRALRWRLLMEPLGYSPGRANTYLVVLIGYFFNLLVPRLGEVMKCTMLARYEKVPADKMIGTIVAERAVDVACLVLVTFIMLATQFQVLGETALDGLKQVIHNSSWLKLLFYVVGIIAAFILLRYLLRRFKRNRVIHGIRLFSRGIWHGLTSIGKIREKGWFLFHTLVIWLLYLLSIWLGFKAFPAVASMGLNASVAILVFGSLGMIVTQGGIGAYQLAVQKTLMLYGISAVTGLAFGWVLWGAQTAIVIAAGIAALTILPIMNRKKI